MGLVRLGDGKPTPQSVPDVSGDGWAFAAPSPTPMRPDAPQSAHDPQEVFDALRWIVRAGAPRRSLPHGLPPRRAVSQRTRRRIDAGCFGVMVRDRRALSPGAAGRADDRTAAVLDSRTVQSTPGSGARAGWDGRKRRKGTKTHAAVDTLGHLLALVVGPANARDRASVAGLVDAVQGAAGAAVEGAWVDQGYAGERARADAAARGIRLEAVKLDGAKRGFVLLPRRWVVERSFARAARFRRLARDYERPPGTVDGLPFLAFACLMLQRLVTVVADSP